MDYTVWINTDGTLGINPPIDEYDGMKIDIVIGINRYGEVTSIETRKDALLALYDEYQTNENIKDGDTFTFRGESKPFAMASGIHVLPC